LIARFELFEHFGVCVEFLFHVEVLRSRRKLDFSLRKLRLDRLREDLECGDSLFHALGRKIAQIDFGPRVVEVSGHLDGAIIAVPAVGGLRALGAGQQAYEARRHGDRIGEFSPRGADVDHLAENSAFTADALKHSASTSGALPPSSV